MINDIREDVHKLSKTFTINKNRIIDDIEYKFNILEANINNKDLEIIDLKEKLKIKEEEIKFLNKRYNLTSTFLKNYIVKRDKYISKLEESIELINKQIV